MDNGLLILNEEEFLKHIHNRYNRIYVEGLVSALKLIKDAPTKQKAEEILSNKICVRAHAVSDNIAEINSILGKVLKRGNPRRKSTVGL